MARPRAAEATEGLGLNAAAAAAELPLHAGELVQRLDVTARGVLDVSLREGDVWHLQLSRGAVISVAGAGEAAVVPLIADSWARLQGPAAQRPGSTWYATRAAHVRAEGVMQAWTNGRPGRPEAVAADEAVEPPSDGRRGEVEGLLAAWAR
eukprot:9243289-Alexandrium_andersonii.AAC.1